MATTTGQLASDDKVTLLHLEHSQSQLVLWVLEELGCPYNFKLIAAVQSGPNKGRAPEELKETHPVGKSPQLVLPGGRVLAERSAITVYLLDKYDSAGKFKINKSDPENDIYREEMLMSVAGTSLNPMLMIGSIFAILVARSPFLMRPVTRTISSQVRSAFLDSEISTMMSYLDSELQGRDYFMGTKEPTKVDFCIMWYIDLATQNELVNLEDYPRLKAWSDRCKARPAWRKALDIGGGYDIHVRQDG